MLIKFSFKNFKSFKNENCLDMEATSLKEHEYNILEIEGNKYLRVSAIYGANASGKTNVLEAFDYMKRRLMITDDTKNMLEAQENYFSFMINEEPIALEVECLAKNNKLYKYGFEAKKNEIVSEWLYYKKINKFYTIFERSGKTVEFDRGYDKKKGKFEIDSNSLFLSLITKLENNNEDFKSVYNWFLNANYLDLGNPKFENKINTKISTRLLEDNNYKNELVKFLKTFDFGIDDIEITPNKLKDISNNNVIVEVKFVHKNEKGEKRLLPFTLESKGTLKMFYLFNFIMMALKDGMVLFIDELDAKLHPLLTRYLINLFHDNTKNTGNGQLIYSTHDTVNLNKDTFRRDEIWFTEKDKDGVSELFSLSDYKIGNSKIRNDATYNKDYLTGRYGAIPVFEEFKVEFSDEKRN